MKITKITVLVLSLLLTTEAFAVSGSSAKPIGRRAKQKKGRATNIEKARTNLETLESKAQELGINLKIDIDKVLKDLEPSEALKVGNQAKDLETSLEAKKAELSEAPQMRLEIETVLQVTIDALSTRSEYAKAIEAKEEHKENGDLSNLREVVGILDNALNIARSKVEDSQNVSKDDMITIFQTITGLKSGAAQAVIQARQVLEAIKNMGKTALEIRSCE